MKLNISVLLLSVTSLFAEQWTSSLEVTSDSFVYGLQTYYDSNRSDYLQSANAFFNADGGEFDDYAFHTATLGYKTVISFLNSGLEWRDTAADIVFYTDSYCDTRIPEFSPCTNVLFGFYEGKKEPRRDSVWIPECAIKNNDSCKVSLPVDLKNFVEIGDTTITDSLYFSNVVRNDSATIYNYEEEEDFAPLYFIYKKDSSYYALCKYAIKNRMVYPAGNPSEMCRANGNGTDSCRVYVCGDVFYAFDIYLSCRFQNDGTLNFDSLPSYTVSSLTKNNNYVTGKILGCPALYEYERTGILPPSRRKSVKVRETPPFRADGSRQGGKTIFFRKGM